jgi:hypothetical protein
MQEVNLTLSKAKKKKGHFRSISDSSNLNQFNYTFTGIGKHIHHELPQSVMQHKDIIVSSKLSPTILTYSKKVSPSKNMNESSIIKEEIDLSN